MHNTVQSVMITWKLFANNLSAIEKDDADKGLNYYIVIALWNIYCPWASI